MSIVNDRTTAGRPSLRATAQAGMSLFLCVLSLVCINSTSGQYLETTIMLPDSLGGAYALRCMAYNPVNRAIYVGDQRDAVLVVDAVTHRRVARIEIGAPVINLCCNTADNKLYVSCGSSWRDSTVKVIDCETNTVLRTVLVGRTPAAMSYNPFENKVYVANYGGSPMYDSTVSVIDGATDSVLARIFVGARPGQLLHNSRNNKLYVGLSGGTAVIDCAVDSVVAFLEGIGLPLGYNPTHNKVYCGGVVLDGDADTVVARLWRPAVLAFFNPASGKAYCVRDDGYSTVMVYDGATDSLLTKIRLNPSQILRTSVLALEGSLRDGKVYCSHSGGQGRIQEIVVVGGEPDTILARVPVSAASALSYGHEPGEVYAMSSLEQCVAVIDCAADTLENVVYLGLTPVYLCTNPDENKVYALQHGEFGAVLVLDAATNRPTTMTRTGWRPNYLAYNSHSRKLYCSNRDSTIAVISGRTDSLVAVTGLDQRSAQLAFNPTANKLYSLSATDGSIAVVCGYGDSVLRTIYPVPEGAGYMGYVPATNKLYCVGGESISVVECDGDTVAGEMRIESGVVTRMCATRNGGKVYFGSGGARILTIVDGEQDTLLKTVILGGNGRDLIYNGLERKLYSADYDNSRVIVLDCVADTVIRDIAVGEKPTYLSLDSVNNRLYCSHAGGTSVIDCNTDSVIAVLQPMSGIMAFDPHHHRTFVKGPDWSLIYVIKDTALGLAESSRRAATFRQPTLSRGALLLRGAEPAALFDIRGREAAELVPGWNDIRNISPGVYFLVGRRSKAPVKVVIVR